MKIVKICSLILFGILLGLFLAEMGLRLLVLLQVKQDLRQKAQEPIHRYSSGFEYINKPYVSYYCGVEKDKPSYCRYNRYGFRDGDYAYSKPKNVCRIVMLGDSMTMGLGVNAHETFAKKLEDKLNKNQEKYTYEVLNLGTTGMGATHYKNLYKEIGRKFDADIVVTNFLIDNDVLNSYTFKANNWYLTLRAIPDEYVPVGVNNFLKQHSVFWAYTLVQYYGSILIYDQNFDKVLFKNDMKKNYYHTYQIEPGEFMKDGWRLTEESFTKLSGDVTKNNAHHVLVGIPLREKVIKDDWQMLKKQGYVVDERLYTNQESRKKFEVMCKKYNWDCLTMHDRFAKTPNNVNLFLKEDIHFTPAGHELAADIIYTKIQSKIKKTGCIN